jgi:hypothetical protein
MFTNIIGKDGFGAQYQRIIQTFIYCKANNLKFCYCPFKNMEHNYENSENFISRIERLINLKDNIENRNIDKCKQLDYGGVVLKWFEANIDKNCNNEHMEFIKDCFWKNKERELVFNNNKINIAIHIRRENQHDKGRAGERITTPNEYYLNVMNNIRENNKNKDVLFHIYSQGEMNNFAILQNEDVIFHLDEDICKTFIELVGADILVTSPSSLSYVAALISDGEIYYKQFWHKPRSNWIVCK